MTEKKKISSRNKIIVYISAILCITAITFIGYFVPLDTYSIRSCAGLPNNNVRHDVIFGGTAPFNKEKKYAQSHTDKLPEVGGMTGCFVPIVHRLYLL